MGAAIDHMGAQVRVAPVGWDLTPRWEDLVPLIGPSTRAVILAHLRGRPAPDIDRITDDTALLERLRALAGDTRVALPDQWRNPPGPGRPRMDRGLELADPGLPRADADPIGRAAGVLRAYPESALAWVSKLDVWSTTPEEDRRVCAAVNARLYEQIAVSMFEERWLKALSDAAGAWAEHMHR